MEKLPWHIPKRSNLLQLIGSIHVLKNLDLSGKKWTTNNAKKFNQALGTWGLTSSGNSLSSTARETLEALLKYLGFIYIDSEQNLYITPAGYDLFKEFKEFKKPEKHLKLNDTENIYNYKYSAVVTRQLQKLVLTNPTIEERHLNSNTKIQPFIETLFFCLSLQGLTREEIAMFVFFQQNTEERGRIIDEIKEYRSHDDLKKGEIITEFASTYIGNKVYGESSATVKYFESILKLSGLFEEKTGLYLKNESVEMAGKIVDSSENIPDFLLENILVWLGYFCDSRQVRFPRKVTLNLKNLKDYKLLLNTKQTESQFIDISFPHLKTEGESFVSFLVFPEIKYDISLKVLTKDKVQEITFRQAFNFSHNEFIATIDNNSSVNVDPPKRSDYLDELKEMVSCNCISQNYIASLVDLLLLSNIVESKKKAKDYIEKRKNLIKGGRFETLFFELLKNKEKEGVIDSVVEWRGKIENGIYYPSPAGKGYETDIEFTVGKYYFGLELTTATGRAQWKTEAESVTDHIGNLKENVEKSGNQYKVIGMFTSPRISQFMYAICYYFAKHIYHVPILSIESNQLMNILLESNSKEALISKIREYFGDTDFTSY